MITAKLFGVGLALAGFLLPAKVQADLTISYDLGAMPTINFAPGYSLSILPQSSTTLTLVPGVAQAGFLGILSYQFPNPAGLSSLGAFNFSGERSFTFTDISQSAAPVLTTLSQTGQTDYNVSHGGGFTVGLGSGPGLSFTITGGYAGLVTVTPIQTSFVDFGHGTGYNIIQGNFLYTPVPEPTTILAGALLLLPLGVSTLSVLRKNRA